MDGWSELGAVLGGGGQLKQQAYQMGVETGARQAGLLEQARKLRDANLARAAITPEAITSAQTDPNGSASLVSALLHADKDPRELSGYQKDEQHIDFNRDAMAAATDPTVPLDSLNRRMIVIGGKPVDLTKIEGDVALNPMVSPGAQTIAPTQIGLADMMLKGAQAGAANAAAGEHAANTRLADTKTAAGGFAPDHGETKPTLPPIGLLGAMLGQGYDKATGTVSIPPEKVQQFAAWQARKAESDPRYNNGAFALQHYASEAPLGAGINDTPADVGASSLDAMMGAEHAGAVAAPAAAKAPAAPAMKKNPDGAYLPTSREDFDALPSGSLFVNPADGQLRRKH